MNTNETWLMPVSKKTLSRVVTYKITEALANGQLKPGDYLPSEGQLAENLNVGKSSVREATKMLEAVGVVEIIKGRGCRIRTTIDSDALNPLAYQLILQSNTSHEKLVEFRRVIESTVSCLAVKTISKEEVSRLKNICLNMEENMSHDVNNLELDIEFHKIIYSSTQPSIAISNKKHPEVVLANHKKILEAFEHESEEDMADAIRESISKWETLSLQD